MVITGLKSFVNIFFIKKENGYIMVDTGMNSKAVDSAFRGTGISPDLVSHIIITHGHQDHYGGAAHARELTGASVIAHESALEAMRSGTSEKLISHSMTGRIISFLMPKQKVRPVEADIIIQDEFSLQDGDHAIRILHTPGHSKGSVSIVLESGEIFCGDLLRGRPGKLNFSIWYDNYDDMVESLRKIEALEPEIIYLSHGSPITNEDLGNFLANLK